MGWGEEWMQKAADELSHSLHGGVSLGVRGQNKDK